MMSQQMNPQMQQQQQPAENKSNNMISSDKPYVCDICGRGYSYLASLEQHKVIRRFRSEKIFNVNHAGVESQSYH